MATKSKVSTGVFLLLMMAAYLFGIGMRTVWVDFASGSEGYRWKDQITINTNDGYYWAEGARDILAGSHEAGDRSPVDQPISRLTALLAKVLPFSFETIILYMSSFLGSLLVIPLMLLGRETGRDDVGFIAALLGVIAWSYYNRTMVGYYDTDMLTIVLPTFILWGITASILHKRNRYMALTSLFFVLYGAWYASAKPLELAFLAIIAIYTVVFERHERTNYKLMLFVSFALLPIGWLLQSILIVLGFVFFHFGKARADRATIALLVVSVAAYGAMGGFGAIWYYIEAYLLRDTLAQKGQMDLHYYAVNKTVRESGRIAFDLFANRISGHPITFLASLAGYLLFALRYRIMWLALPMLGLGFLAMGGGLRFTVYAVPVMALGAGYLIVYAATEAPRRYLPGAAIALSLLYAAMKFNYIARYIDGSEGIVSGMVKLYSSGALAPDFGELIAYMAIFLAFLVLAVTGERLAKKICERLYALLLLALVLVPNISHIYSYDVPVVFSDKEIAVLDRLGKIADREDYVLAWWDYGYPIRYYANVKTVVDGGKHNGGANFPISFVLSEAQLPSANMARLVTEYTENVNSWGASGSYLEKMMADRNITDPDIFLELLSDKDFTLPPKTREVYYYLPMRMLNILPTVAIFSSIDLKSGKVEKESFFYMADRIVRSGDRLILGKNVLFDMKKGVLGFGKHILPINRFVIAVTDKSGKVDLKENIYDRRSNVYILFMPSYNRLVVMDRKLYESAYVQMFVLGRYDKELFEPVIITPWAKVYRLKR